MPDVPNQGEVEAYQLLRKIVGVLGIALPVVMAFWGFAYLGWWSIEPSISDYYALRTRDAFIGILFAVGWFLFAYEDYEREDKIAGKIGSIAALCVAIFPTTEPGWQHTMHQLSAGVLFLVLAFFCLCLFTKHGPQLTLWKERRNRVYRIAGWTIIACIALIAVYLNLLEGTVIASWKPVFWLESASLWAFGWAWFVKGGALLYDRPESPVA